MNPPDVRPSVRAARLGVISISVWPTEPEFGPWNFTHTTASSGCPFESFLGSRWHAYSPFCAWDGWILTCALRRHTEKAVFSILSMQVRTCELTFVHQGEMHCGIPSCPKSTCQDEYILDKMGTSRSILGRLPTSNWNCTWAPIDDVSQEHKYGQVRKSVICLCSE